MSRNKLWRGDKYLEVVDKDGHIHREPTPPEYTPQQQRIKDLNKKIEELLE